MREVILRILFFCIPILFEGWFEWKKDIKISKKVFRCIMVCAASSIIVWFIHRYGSFSLTIYEYFFLDIELSIFMAMFIGPFLAKENMTLKQVLHMVCLMISAAALYSTVSFGQTVIHSDTATATLLAQCQIRHKSIFPSSWCYVNGDIWVIASNIFVMPFSLILDNQSLARVLGSASLIIITLGGMYYQSRRAFRDDSWMLSIPVFLIFLHGHDLWKGSADMVLYQAAYTGQMLLIVLTYTWVYSIFFEKRSRRKIICFAVIMVLFCMGGIRIIAESSLPLWCACIIFLYIQNMKKQRMADCKDGLMQAVYMSAVIWIPSVIGYGIYKWLCASCTVFDTENNAIWFVGSFKSCWDNLITVIVNMFENFGFAGNVALFSIHGIGNMISVSVCIVVVFIVPVLQLRRLKEENEATVYFYIFGMVHNAVMILMAVLFGKLQSRYLLSAIYVSIIISAHYVMQHWWRPESMQKKVRMMIFIAAAAVQCIVLLRHNVGWTETVREKKAFAQELVDRGLQKGYATYWNAYTNEVYSDLRLRMGGVKVDQNGITPYRWLVDQEIFLAEDTSTFLMLNDEENEIIGGKIPELYGEPMQEFMLKELYVYVFDYDIMEKIN